jgi:hypothetical protein
LPRAIVAVARIGAPGSIDGDGRTRLTATGLPLVKIRPGTQVTAPGNSLLANRAGAPVRSATSTANGRFNARQQRAEQRQCGRN